MPVAYRTSRARPAGRYSPSDRRMRSPCRPPRQVSGAVQPARWELFAVDLSWREGHADPVASETGVAVVDGDGQILDACWTRGVEQTIGWADSAAGDGDAVLFADAPLVVRDVPGQRVCQTQAGQRCGHWQVSANTTNAHSPPADGRAVPAPGWTVRLAIFRPQRRATAQWPFRFGNLPVRRAGRRCGTLAMTPNGPATSASHRLRVAPWQIERATTCDTLIARLGQLAKADPSLLLQSHPVSSDLAGQPSPVSDPAYKHREDLIDACCAPGPHHCGRATVSTAARSSACPPIPRAARQPP